MKVYVTVRPGLSCAMSRVEKALRRYAPADVTIVETEAEADLVVLHVIGYPETLEKTQELLVQGKRYAIIQYCVRTTQKSNTFDWLSIWQKADLVWSYYDLNNLAIEDGLIENGTNLSFAGVNFVMTPLGVDDDFRPTGVEKKFLITTSGYVPESEGVLEVMQAAKTVEGLVFHLGPHDERYGKHVFSDLGISDTELAGRYSQSYFVAGLRRGEGFEMPVIEGLACGARPICFDRPHYRQWFGDFAYFIPEGTFEEVTASLEKIFQSETLPVSQQEMDTVRSLFNWQNITGIVWSSVRRRQPRIQLVRGELKRKSVLWVGDAGVESGFARITHNIVRVLQETMNVAVLGLNYNGDPHEHPFPIHPCRTYDFDRDTFGIRRIPELVERYRPDVMVVQNDPWNIPRYMHVAGDVPVVGFIAVDGENCRGRALNGLKKAIFWTQFGLAQARQGGFVGPAGIVPLGVETLVYRPMNRSQARYSLPFRPEDRERLQNAFIVGTVNRNQPRKRLDLLMSYFAEWIKTRGIEDALLFMHVAPTGDQGIDLHQFAEYLGIANKTIIIVPELGQGAGEDRVAITYNSFDVLATTSQAEGWALPTMEAMSCGVACIVPGHSAFNEWPEDAVYRVPCSEIAVTPNNINVVGRIPDRQEFLNALDLFYHDRSMVNEYGQRGYNLVHRAAFTWRAIGERFRDELESTLSGTPIQFSVKDITPVGV